MRVGSVFVDVTKDLPLQPRGDKQKGHIQPFAGTD